ncbi:MAG: hypothetical protein QM487_02310 [Candidatus Marithrix sp.]
MAHNNSQENVSELTYDKSYLKLIKLVVENSNSWKVMIISDKIVIHNTIRAKKNYFLGKKHYIFINLFKTISKINIRKI